VTEPAVPGVDARRPRYGRFLGTGAALGLLAAALLALTRSGTEEFDRLQAVLYLMLVLATLGALLGGALAVGLERRAERRRGGTGQSP
jgi:hypothetical protein